MALKDLKSDLSKFRMPKKDPLENKKIDEVNKKIKVVHMNGVGNTVHKYDQKFIKDYWHG